MNKGPRYIDATDPELRRTLYAAAVQFVALLKKDHEDVGDPLVQAEAAMSAISLWVSLEKDIDAWNEIEEDAHKLSARDYPEGNGDY